MLPGNETRFVAVKTLVNFSAKTGSLDRKFTPAPTGIEGTEGHLHVTNNRPDNYQAEVSLNIEYKGLIFRGRADGYAPQSHCIEEIKTFYGDVEKIPANYRALHWAQVKCYGWMYCLKSQCDHINLALVYFNLGDQKEYRTEQTWSATELKACFEEMAEKYSQWHARIYQRLVLLSTWIKALEFPYDHMHAAQRVMAEAVYKAAATGKVFLAEAPTGTGKTLAALFPAIKSMIYTEVDKIFYLTSKTTGKQLALENIALIATDSATPLRTLELTAQEKACLQPGSQCTGTSCIYAFDFFTKLDKARHAASEYAILDKSALLKLALEFELCPFYLSIEMSQWVDIVVADINYYYDGTPLLLGLTQEFNWKPYVLVDESHNLIDRGRQMYSAELDRSQLLSAKKSAPPVLKKRLDAINKHWRKLIKELPEPEEKFTLISSLPEKFSLSLLEFTTRYIEFLQNNPEHPVQHTSAQEFFFAALNFQKVLDALGDDFCIDMQHLHTKAELLTLRNLIPARLLAQRTDVAHCACFFSATLHPAFYYQALLGLPHNSVHIKVPSPFNQNQLAVKIATNLSTRFKDRVAAINPICAIIVNQLSSENGNAIAFFSSYDFLQQAEEALEIALRGMDVKLLVQSRRMSEMDRHEFINQFHLHKNVLGLAVLGGAFSEGVDLPGDKLKGVFIATLGLPQVNSINEHLRSLMDTQFQQGYDFTYTYPGIRKVIQAAGRVIRTKSDRGYLWLLDERFCHSNIRKLLPDWWQIEKHQVIN